MPVNYLIHKFPTLKWEISNKLSFSLLTNFGVTYQAVFRRGIHRNRKMETLAFTTEYYKKTPLYSMFSWFYEWNCIRKKGLTPGFAMKIRPQQRCSWKERLPAHHLENAEFFLLFIASALLSLFFRVNEGWECWFD